MKSLFLDTSGWFAALSPEENSHREALKLYRSHIQAGDTLITSNLVVAEMQILLSRFRGAHEGVRFLDSLYQDATHGVVFADRELERNATDRWLRKFADHPISLADAVSFEIMRTHRIRSALTLDEHFTLAGFACIP